MVSITITLSDEKWQKLKEQARRLGFAPEELAQTNLANAIDKTADMEAQISRLEVMAAKLNISVRELVGNDLEKWLTPLDEDSKQAMEYVLTKNAELYRRLA
jgi:hypothetical protein